MVLRVLIVDDSRIARSVLSRALQRIGCEVVGLAQDGVEAINMYKRLRPDLVTMDLVMPKMSGQEAVKALREYDPAAIVVVISSLAKKETVVECVKSGVSHYLIKPFKQDSLAAVIRKLFPDAYARPDADDSVIDS